MMTLAAAARRCSTGVEHFSERRYAAWNADTKVHEKLANARSRNSQNIMSKP
jgi:hypothetical protein